MRLGPEDRIRVGYFPNLTHAVAMVGLERGFFAAALGSQTAIDTKVFNAGPAEMEALFAGAIDLGYIGPGPAITGFVRSKGKALRVVAGAAMGGASLIVRPDAGIERSADLAGKRIASPQIGNTQDIALRTYLRAAGLGAADGERHRDGVAARQSRHRDTASATSRSTVPGYRSPGHPCCGYRRAARS